VAFSEFETHRYSSIVEKYVATRRPPPEIRNELDVSFRIEGQSLEIYEIRPAFDNPEEKVESPIAKTTYVKTTDNWKLYWMRADLKWHEYSPDPIADTLEDALAIIDADELACFYG
jgi:hypothetical protein